MRLREQESKAKDQPKVATHMARVLGIVDLGLRPEWIYQGDTKPAEYKLEITYELVNSLMEDGRPHIISEEVTNKISKNKDSDKISNLTRRIKAFNADFDNASTWLGQPCMVTLKENARGYVNVAGQTGISPVPEGMPVKELTNDTYMFDLEQPDLDMFLNFPEWKQNKIKDNLEFDGSPLQIDLDRVS